VYDRATAALTLIGDGATSFTIVQGINRSYVAVGSDVIFGSPTTRPAFLFDITTGTRTDVLLPGARRSAFRDISDDGVVTGWYQDSAGIRHAFTGYPDALQTLDLPGADNTFGEGSNNAGVVVGNFDAPGVLGAFIAVPVPEPAAIGLLTAIGLPFLCRCARSARSR
jgi:hypothetical protein